MPDLDRLYYLLDRYIDETASAGELDELKLLLNDQSHESIARDRLVNLLRQTEPLPEHSESRWQAILQGIKAESIDGPLSIVTADTAAERLVAAGRKPLSRRWWSVAAALLLGGVALWLLRRPDAKEKPQPGMARLQHDRVPGGNVALLTLSDGSTITLDSAHDGVLAQQGNSRVTKLKNGQLAYKALDEKPAAAVFNTLTTPRGGQYRLVLPDGSEVWLNAASSITYPTFFSGKDRTVKITGEAYFEIAQNAAMPFKVIVNAPIGEQEVEVLGTHFNVKAYNDESTITTTLLEGSVRLSARGVATMLRPGQQGMQQGDGNIRMNLHADTEAAIAWKNGLFHFEHTDIQEVMRQLSRWYNVDVVFEGRIPDEKFDGEITRNNNLTEVLKILQLSNVHFRIDNNKVTVTP
ncbi:MAG: FecR family protein [Bacteroidetes bacterium]|nr:FecR family protein [Bacteroidota bacterium]